MPKIWKFGNLGGSGELKLICVFILDPIIRMITYCLGEGMVFVSGGDWAGSDLAIVLCSIIFTGKIILYRTISL